MDIPAQSIDSLNARCQRSGKPHAAHVSPNTQVVNTFVFSTDTPFLTVVKVENGFIVEVNGKTYVCKTAEEVVQYLKE